MPKALAVIVVLALAGCASQIMSGYVGKSVNEPIMDYGPPANVIQISASERAYQWAMRKSGVVPLSTPSMATVYGTGGYATVMGQSTTYIPYSHDCLYTLTAKQVGSDWIVDGYREPRLGCE